MISATILTKNSEKTLRKTLDSLEKFAEVIVLDSGSSDSTLTIAKEYPNVVTFTSPFLGFGPMHNYAAKLASNDWILSIDSDEVLTSGLIDELLSLPLEPSKIYSIQRHNYFNGKHIKYCAGWHPDWVLRLYNQKETRFSDDLVHEKILKGDLTIQKLKSPLDHVPIREIGDFLSKMQHYSSLFAEQNADQKGSFFQALLHGWYAFTKSYLFKRGILAGKEGFVISMYSGHTAFYKYLKLAEKSSKPN